MTGAEFIKRVRHEFARWDVPVEIETGRRHNRAVFSVGGQQQFYVFPNSPSDARAIHNTLADIRRAVGVTNGRPKSERPKRTRADEPEPAIPAITPGKDWKAPLREWDR